MRYYFEAYDSDGQIVLGNCDGQLSIDTCAPLHSRHFRALESGESRPAWPRVSYWKVVDSRGREVATINNIFHEEWVR